MFESIQIVYQEIKASKKGMDFVLYSLLWMVISAIAAYPDLLHFKTDFLFATDINEYHLKVILPFILFLSGFTFDFWMATKGLDMHRRRGRLYRCLVFFLVAVFVLFAIPIVINYKWIKYISFALIWITISFIKGFTILISWNGRNIQVKQPQKNIMEA